MDTASPVRNLLPLQLSQGETITTMNSRFPPRGFHSEPPPHFPPPENNVLSFVGLAYGFALVCRSQTAVLGYYKINSYLRKKKKKRKRH